MSTINSSGGGSLGGLLNQRPTANGTSGDSSANPAGGAKPFGLAHMQAGTPLGLPANHPAVLAGKATAGSAVPDRRGSVHRNTGFEQRPQFSTAGNQGGTGVQSVNATETAQTLSGMKLDDKSVAPFQSAISSSTASAPVATSAAAAPPKKLPTPRNTPRSAAITNPVAGAPVPATTTPTVASSNTSAGSEPLPNSHSTTFSNHVSPQPPGSHAPAAAPKMTVTQPTLTVTPQPEAKPNEEAAPVSGAEVEPRLAWKELHHGVPKEEYMDKLAITLPGVADPFQWWDVRHDHQAVPPPMRVCLEIFYSGEIKLIKNHPEFINAVVEKMKTLGVDMQPTQNCNKVREAGCMYALVAVPVTMLEVDSGKMGKILFKDFGKRKVKKPPHQGGAGNGGGGGGGGGCQQQ